jgi:hypothetical protein
MNLFRFFLKVSIFYFALCGIANAQEDCQKNKQVIGATFEVIDDIGAKKREVTVWRQSEGRVIYEMKNDAITRIYEDYGKGQAAVIEHFDIDKIGVEYEPSSAVIPRGFTEVYRYFEIPNMGGLNKVNQGTFECFSVTDYEGVIDGHNIKLSYIDGAEFPKQVTITQGEHKQTRTLVKLHYSDKALQQTLTRLASHRTFDFADLGDHEDEDFFRKSKHLKYRMHAANDHNH